MDKKEQEDARIQRRIRRGSLLLSQGSSSKHLGSSTETLDKSIIANAWTEHATAEGATYYYNSVSKKTTWDTPTEFALTKEKKSTPPSAKKAKWVWIKDEVACFAPATLVKERGQYKTLDGRVVQVDEGKDVVAEIADIDAVTRDVDDMVTMELINEASVLQNLRVRAERDEYFTNVGTILVSVNPFKWLDHLYTPEKFLLYRDRMIGDEVPPHFFEISDNAYRGMREDNRSQSIIISGESGSGKTEATKKCLQFLADVAGSNFGLENKLLATNPILEAFGNAKTLRNGNSSRFGKWTAVHFDKNGRICGGMIVNYLLEKSRVGIQLQGERNYHIFYQMIKGASEEQRNNFRLAKSCSVMNFLTKTGGTLDIPGVDDGEMFQETLEALDELEFTKASSDDLFRTLSGLLWLGNIQFETPVGASADDACIVNQSESEHAIECASELLGFTKESLLENLMNRIRHMGGQDIKTPLNAQLATDSCSALAREIYGRIFDWLVRRINEKLIGTAQTAKIIGVLDIFGFEIFQHNSFEQLCINFTNEKLQQHFNNHTFKTEQIVYESEGIEFDPPKFTDNADVLDLLEKKPTGVFVLLDDECAVPRGGDSSFHSKIVKEHEGSHARFASGPKLKAKAKLSFAVQHYAGLVVYDAAGFLEKNKDDLRDNLISLMKSSSLPFINTDLFNITRGDGEVFEESGSSPKRKSRRHKTQAGFFRKQLDELMTVLNATDPHYIRCIKPNTQKCADHFDPFLCLEQLRYSGVFEAIEIRKQGFPFRRFHEYFYRRYRSLAAGYTKKDLPFKSGDYGKLCQRVIKAIASRVKKAKSSKKKRLADVSECRLGHTMVLYRAPEHLTLESLREQERFAAAIVIQKYCRLFVAKLQMLAFLATKEELLQAIASRDVETIQDAIVKAKTSVRPPFSLYKEFERAEALLETIQAEIEVCRGIEELEHILQEEPNSAAQYYEDIEVVLTKSHELRIPELYPQYRNALDDFEKRIAAVRMLIEAKRDLRKGVDCSIKSVLVDAIQRATSLKEEHGEFCEDDLNRAKEMLNRVVAEEKMVDALMSGLENGGAKGSVGNLNVASIDTKPLRAAWNEAKSNRKLTPRAMALVHLSDLVLALREGIREYDWDSIEGILAQVDDMETENLFTTFKLPRKEVDLYQGELNCFTIITELKASISHGQVAGEPGNLDLKNLSVDHLKADIEDARVLACPAPVASTVINYAELIMHLRRAVGNGDWDKVGEVLKTMKELSKNEDRYHAYAKDFFDATKSEVKLVENEMLGQTIITKSCEALSTSNVHGAVGEITGKGVSTKLLDAVQQYVQVNTETGKCPTEASQSFLDLVNSVSQIRTAVLADKLDDKKIRTLVLSTLASAEKLKAPQKCIEELRLVRSDVTEKECIGIMENAATKGKAGGKVGELKLDSIDIAPLQKALDDCRQLWKDSGMFQGAESTYGTKLTNAMEELMKIRTALKATNWDVVEDILQHSTSLHVGCLEKEVTLIQEELNNRIIVAELTKALETGKAEGKVGSLDLESIQYDSLREDISDAKELGCKTKEAKELLANATLILDLREGMSHNAWDRVEHVLEQFKFQKIAPVAREEVQLAQKEVNDRKINHAIEHALESGFATGTLDDLRVDTITFHVIDEALALAQKLKCESPRAHHLYAATKIIQAGRAAMSQGRFIQLGPLIEDAERQGFIYVEGHDEGFDQEKYDMVKPAHSELNLMHEKFEDESMKADLTNALAQGRVSGRIGALELSSVKLGDLLKLTSKYSLTEPKTKKAHQLLTAATMIVSLREGLMSGPDWEEVRRIVDKFKPENMMKEYGFEKVQEVETELELVRDELEHREVVSLLTKGLTHGMVVGSIGALDLSNLSVEELNQSIDKVKTMNRKTPEATRLFDTAIAIRDVRLCVLEAKSASEKGIGNNQSLTQSEMDAQWLGAVQVALDKAHGIGVSDDAKDEVKLIQDHVDDIKIIRELCSALQQGSVSGALGKTEGKSCDTERLVSALKCAHTLVCKTERAKKLEKTAKLVLELRKALLASGDWLELSTLLEKRLGVSIEGGTPPETFHGYSDEASEEFQRLIDESRERQVNEALTKGLESGNVKGTCGKLVVADVEVETLAKAIEFAERVGSHLSKYTNDLGKLAKSILAIREALRHGGKEEEDIESVSATLASLPSFEKLGEVKVPTHCHDELTLALDHVHNHKIIALIKSSLKEGHGGSPVRIELIDPTELKSALKTIHGSLEGPKSTEAKDMVDACDLILRLRISLQERDYDSLRGILAEAMESAGLTGLPDAENQVYAARSLLVNHDLVQSLCEGLDHGSILENAESPSSVSADGLRKPLREGKQQVGGDIDDSVSCLIEFCELIVELRSAFRAVVHENWSLVDSILVRLENLRMKTEKQEGEWEGEHVEQVREHLQKVYAEIDLVHEMAEEVKAYNSILESISEGHICGTVGNVSTSLLKVSPLELAIRAGSDLKYHTERMDECLVQAKNLLSLRKAILKDDWETVLDISKKWKHDVAETAFDSQILKLYNVELELAYEEANRRVVVDGLTEAIKNGAVEGEPGSIGTRHVSVALLNKAIAKALEIGAKTQDAQQLLLAAHTIRQIRNGILADVGEGGGGGHVNCVMVRDAIRVCNEEGGQQAFPQVAQREIGLVQAELEDQDAAKILTDALRGEDDKQLEEGGEDLVDALKVEILSIAISKTQEDKCHTIFSKALYKLAFIMRDLRRAMLDSDWNDAGRLVRILDDISGRVSQSDAPISTQEKQNQQWRAALVLIQNEVDRSRDAVQNAKLVALLREGMLNGQAPGHFGYLRTEKMDVEALDKAIEYAVDQGCKTEEATTLYKTARLLRQVRSAILDEDFITASVVISEARAYSVTFGESIGNAGTDHAFHRLPVAGSEFELLHHEVQNKLVCRQLKSALKAGAVTGRVGAVSVTESNINALEKAMSKAEHLARTTDETHILVHSCKVILQLRKILIETPAVVAEQGTVAIAKMWDAAQEIIRSASANSPANSFSNRNGNSNITSNNGGVSTLDLVTSEPNQNHHEVVTTEPSMLKSFNLMWCHPDCRDELILLLDEIQHREALQKLHAAIATGNAKFLGGFVDVSTVKTGSLQAAINNAKGVPTRSEEITLLQLSATVLLRCREALLDGSWQDLRDILVEAGKIKIHEAAFDEVNLLRREVHLHSVIKAVLLNLQEACAERNVDALEAALAEADSLRLGSSPDLHVLARVNKARQLLERLVLVDERLKQSVKSSDLHGLENVMEEAEQLQYKPKSLPLATDLRNRLQGIFHRADTALENVDGEAIATILEEAKREGIALPRANEMRRILSYPPSQVERMRLNAALERGDEETVVKVTTAIKTRFFEDETTRERHRLEYYRELRSPEEYATNTGVVASALSEGMLSHSSTPIPTSLTKLPSAPATSLAVKIFRALLGYCGDREYMYPASLAEEILQVGLAVSELRDEIFLQLIKQLTDNPSQESRERCWLLFKTALQAFPPSEGFENYLELWLRRKGVELRGRNFSTPKSRQMEDNWANLCLLEMHKSVFRGPSLQLPSLDPIYVHLGTVRDEDHHQHQTIQRNHQPQQHQNNAQSSSRPSTPRSLGSVPYLKGRYDF